MKKIILIFSALMFSYQVFSQANVQQEIKAYMKDKGWNHGDTYYAYLSEGEQTYKWRTFYEDCEYAIFAFSTENGVKDIDIYLYDNDGTLLTKSASSDEWESITYNPYSTRRMKMVVKNYDSYSSSREYKVYYMVFFK